jgi:hypothetical protein
MSDLNPQCELNPEAEKSQELYGFLMHVCPPGSEVRDEDFNRLYEWTRHLAGLPAL